MTSLYVLQLGLLKETELGPSGLSMKKYIFGNNTIFLHCDHFFNPTCKLVIFFQNADIGIGDLGVEAQRYILSNTVNSKLCQEYPPSIQYQRTFVKKILNTVIRLALLTVQLKSSCYFTEIIALFELLIKDLEVMNVLNCIFQWNQHNISCCCFLENSYDLHISKFPLLVGGMWSGDMRWAVWDIHKVVTTQGLGRGNTLLQNIHSCKSKMQNPLLENAVECISYHWLMLKMILMIRWTVIITVWKCKQNYCVYFIKMALDFWIWIKLVCFCRCYFGIH